MLKVKTEKKNFKVPDDTSLVRDVEYAKVVKYHDYFKVNLVYGDKSWSVRLRDAQEVVKLLSKTVKKFTKQYEIGGFTVYGIGEIGNSSYAIDTDYDTINAEESQGLETVKNELAVEKNEGLIVEKNKKEKNTMNFNIIKGAVTFDKKVAFNIDGKYKYVNAAGAVAEVLPQFVLIKDIPAMVPTIADKITKGVYYSDGEALYYAKEDNRVINLATGIVADILISSIPMTDKVIVYKPVIGADGKFEFKDLIQAQMLQKLGTGNDSLMALAFLGDGDFDVKTMALLGTLGGKNGTNDINALLPLMLLDKDKDTDFENILMLQALGGKNDNLMQTLLLSKMFEKDSKKKKEA